MTRNVDIKKVHPVIVLLGILGLATALTYVLDSGQYERDGTLVVPGSYETMQKDRSLMNLFRLESESEDGIARPVSAIGAVLSIPQGLQRMAGLIFMVLIIGGMFGVMTHTGAIDAGLEKLLSSVSGNLYILVPILMLVFSAGSTFLGLASEYLLIIPLMVMMANRLGMSNLVGLAIVTVAVKAGYIASVSNPVPLTIAQPLVGLQIFSGAGFRLVCYFVFLTIGIAFVLLKVRQESTSSNVTPEFHASALSTRHTLVLLAVAGGVAFLVFGSNRWHWQHHELSAYYIALSVALAIVGGIGASEAASAFVEGMKKVLMASMLIGVASAVAITLEHGQVLDSIVHGLTRLADDHGPFGSAVGMFASQLLIDFVIPSTSGQAAISMPILGPLGQLSGVQPQTTVLTFLFGNGITNILTPTSGTLLAYLATAKVGWVEWAKFVFSLWLVCIATALVLLFVAVKIGF